MKTTLSKRDRIFMERHARTPAHAPTPVLHAVGHSLVLLILVVALAGWGRAATPDGAVALDAIPALFPVPEKEGRTLFIRYQSAAGDEEAVDEGTLVACVDDAGSPLFDLRRWPMRFLNRDNVSFYLHLPGKRGPAPFVVSADLRRLEKSATWDFVIRVQPGLKNIQLWVNGTLVDERRTPARGPTVLAGRPSSFLERQRGLFTGSAPDGADRPAGRVTSVTAWRRALTNAELQQLSARPLKVSEPVRIGREEPMKSPWELAHPMFGPVASPQDVERRFGFLDGHIPAVRSALLQDDSSDLPRFHLVHPGENYNSMVFFHNGRYHHFQTWTPGGCFRYFSDKNEALRLLHTSSADLIEWTWHPLPVRVLDQTENMTFFTDDSGVTVGLVYGARIRPLPQLCRIESRDSWLDRWEFTAEKGLLRGLPERLQQSRHDPAGVFKQGGHWFMTATTVNTQPGAAGLLMPLYQSTDAVDWTFAGEFYASATGTPIVECGALATTGGRALIYLGDYHSKDDPDFQDVSYLVGKIDPQGRFQLNGKGGEGALRGLDKGNRVITAAVNGPEGRVLTWRFRQDWRPFTTTSRNGWRGAQTLPVDIRVAGDDAVQYAPAKELQKLRATSATLTLPVLAEGQTTPLPTSIDARQMEVILTLPRVGASRAGIRLSDGQRTLDISYDQAKHEFVLDAGNQRRISQPAKQATPAVTLHLFFDRCLVDVFGDSDTLLFDFFHFAHPEKLTARLFSEGADTHDLTIEAWTLNPLTWKTRVAE